VQAIVECKKICKLPEKQIFFFFAVRPDIDIFFSPGDPMLEDVVLIEGLSPTEEIDHVIMKGQMGVSWVFSPIYFLLFLRPTSHL